MALTGYLPQQKIVYYGGKAYIDNRPDYSSLGMTAMHPSLNLANAVTQQNLPGLISQKQLVPFNPGGNAPAAQQPAARPPAPLNTMPAPGWTPPGAPTSGGAPGAPGGMSMDQIINGQTFGKAPQAMTAPLPKIDGFQNAIAKALPNANAGTMQNILGM